MSFSYSGDPSASDLDHVRFMLQDTESAKAMLQDEEINFLLQDSGSVQTAAASAATAIARKYARLAKKTVGDLAIDYSDRAKSYAQIASDLASGQVEYGAQLYMGGTSLEAEQDAEDDYRDLSFRVGMHDSKLTTPELS